MKVRGIVATLGLLALLPAIPPAGGQPTKPAGEKLAVTRWWPRSGAYEMTMEMDMDQTLTVNGAVQPKQKTSQTMVMLLKAHPPDAAGDQRLEMQYTRIKLSTGAGAQVLSFDSDEPLEKQNPQLAASFRPLLKATFQVTVGPDGQLKKLAGFDELWEEMARQNPAGRAMLAAMKKQFGEKLMQGLVGQRGVLPKKPVAVGQAWKNATKLPVPFVGEADCVYDCRLKAIENTKAGKVALIDFKGRVKTDKPATTRMGALTLTANKLDMAQSGQIRFNADVGIFESGAIKQSGNIALSGTGGGEDEDVTRIDIRQQLTMRMRTRPAPPKTQPATRPRK